MRLFGKRVSELGSEDFVRIKENKVAESLVLEYKLELHKPNNEGKKELLADVSAMANTSGGILLFGIKEATEDGHNAGYPEEIVGIMGRDGAAINFEQLKQWLDSTIRDGIDPRIQGIEYQDYEHDGKHLFAIAVPRSLQAPHIVKFEGASRFYGRGNTGKFQMDVRQIRDAFNRTNDWRENAEKFRTERIRLHFEKFGGIPGLLLHVVPLGDREAIELKGKASQIASIFPSFGHYGHSAGYNLDGVIKWTSVSPENIQIFRDGGMEYFHPIMDERNEKGEFQIFLAEIPIFTLKYLHHYMLIAQQFGVTPPYAVFLSAVGMKGAYFKAGFGDRKTFAEGRNELLLPGTLIDDSDTTIIQEAMHGTFDILYQACRLAGCDLYSAEGAFTEDYLEG
ncbi:Putative DNA-binding domain-containing protein [Cohnella sp. OV330]|uniref:AlbA family DNA-binding domain-containing protein n=1 Tax=Cohnella sp. OV330 TaxID=1855288 RepID=UPI0008EDED25|nr:ATP-binding protein [Cohnella sp. OV330]SFB62809.1 Putative DNA-binding domain-containing protein [Cohnella sp. OV330]